MTLGDVRARTARATLQEHSTRWAYIAALTPIIFGTTYLLTTEFLPPGRPLLAAMMRSLPTCLVLIIRQRPSAKRVARPLPDLVGPLLIGIVSLLFVAAYRLLGAVAAVIHSLRSLVVLIISVPLLATKIKLISIIAGLLGICGVALLVQRSTARLDGLGLIAMFGAVGMASLATVLTKRWGSPPEMNAIGFTGWTFLFGGLVLLPVTLVFESVPNHLTDRNIGGLVYLVLISGITASAFWFWDCADSGLARSSF